MTTLRQPYYELSPAVYNALVQAKTALENKRCSFTPLCLISPAFPKSPARSRGMMKKAGNVIFWR